MAKERMLVISAHVGDFVWRSAGTIAKYVKNGTEVHVIVLTYGARGESAAFYKNNLGTPDDCRKVRRKEAENAAKVLGVHSIQFCGFDDFPLEMDGQRLEWLAEQICVIRPDFIVTHDNGRDFVNPDHTKTAQAVLKAAVIVSTDDATGHSTPFIPMFGFEPLSPEACGYKPDIYIDITEEWEQKMSAMKCLETQSESMDAYVQKAILRASYCSGRGRRSNCKYAESFSMYSPVYSHDAFVW